MQHREYLDAINQDDVVDNMAELFQPNCSDIMPHDCEQPRHRHNALQHFPDTCDE
jgi:hypothetical protein